jgi:hypothetical protein
MIPCPWDPDRKNLPTRNIQDLPARAFFMERYPIKTVHTYAQVFGIIKKPITGY